MCGILGWVKCEEKPNRFQSQATVEILVLSAGGCVYRNPTIIKYVE